VWAWLNRPATFAEGQVPPYRVEFVTPGGRRGGFEDGVWTAHHGPGLLAAGQLGAQVPPEPGQTAYRDLVYGYGSYVGSLRLVRPTRLEFWADEAAGGGTAVRVRFASDVARPFARLWAGALRVFWGGFGTALDRQVALHLDGAPPSRWRRRPAAALAGLGLAAGLALGARR
jgi:hypothetical protein